MIRFVHWRKMTWALVLWSAAVVMWSVVVGPTVLLGVAWLFGTAGLCLAWFMTQPLYLQGRGLQGGFFVRPGPGNWRVVDLHRVPATSASSTTRRLEGG